MRRPTGGGWIGLLIVMAVVMFLAARAWKSHAPGLSGNDRDVPVSAAREGLDTMEEATGNHAKRLEEALAGE